MRNIVTAALAAALLVFASCSDETARVKEVAYGYSEAMANYRVDDAVEYVTEETVPLLEFSRHLAESVGADYVASDTPATIEINAVEFTSDTTAVASFHKETPIKKLDGTVTLVKRDGAWKVHIPFGHSQKQPRRRKLK